MSTGHLGAGLIMKKAGKSGQELNAGVLWFAALLLDFVYGIFVILGIEHIPAETDFIRMNVVLPYSHGFLTSLGWAALAFLITWLILRKRRSDAVVAAAVVAAAVLSHIVLDVIAFMLGFPRSVTMVIELVIILAGAVAYLWPSRAKSWYRRLGPVVVMVLYVLLQDMPISSASVSSAAPDPRLLMAISLFVWALLVVAAYLLDGEGGKKRAQAFVNG